MPVSCFDHFFWASPFQKENKDNSLYNYLLSDVWTSSKKTTEKNTNSKAENETFLDSQLTPQERLTLSYELSALMYLSEQGEFAKK